MDKFDWVFYLNRYPELFNLGINNQKLAYNHWITKGKYEGKLINNLQTITTKNIEPFINNTKIKILTSDLISSIANYMKKIINNLNINVTVDIINSLTEEDKESDDYYIIIYNGFNKLFLPKFYIMYIIEQDTSNFFKDIKYLNMINKSNILWDFNIKNSIKKIINYPFSNYFYLTCPYVYEYNNYNNDFKYDIFFYGGYNERRGKILKEISKRYNIKIEHQITGLEKENAIKQSKIILNLHHYDNVILETTRINEILNFNKIIISELPAAHDWYNVELYKNSVIFIDEIKDDLSNINFLYKQLDKYLNNNNEYNKKIKLNIENNKILSTKSQFNFIKLLLSLNIGINHKIDYHLIPNTIYCLHLIETPFRINIFNKQKNKPNVEIFPAVKYNPGWIGCALSYVNLIYNAKRYNLDRITICEDDCRFPDNFEYIYNNINDVLNKINKWDIFVGCIADLPEDTIISNVYKYKDIIFIEINKMTSTVFNIYNYSCYDTIINWDFNNKNKYTNTIDRYIGVKNLKIITTYPYYFDCLNVNSTIWDANLYESYNNMFKNSLNIIKKKLDAWDKPIINLDN